MDRVIARRTLIAIVAAAFIMALLYFGIVVVTTAQHNPVVVGIVIIGMAVFSAVWLYDWWSDRK